MFLSFGNFWTLQSRNSFRSNVLSLPFVQSHQDLLFILCFIGRDEWKLVAEKLGLTPEEILFLDKRTRNPAEAMLGHITQRLSVTAGELYDLLNDCGLPFMADIL